MGEQEQRLHRTVAGANLADISTSGFRWREGSTKLERVGQVLLEALDDVRNGFGEGSEVSAAAVTAFERVAEKARTRSKQMRDASDALDRANASLSAAAAEQRALAASAPSEPQAPERTPGVPDSPDTIRAEQSYSRQMGSYQSAMADREMRAKQRADEVDTTYTEAAEVMRRIHGEPDERVMRGAAGSSGGAGGGPGATGAATTGGSAGWGQPVGSAHTYPYGTQQASAGGTLVGDTGPGDPEGTGTATSDGGDNPFEQPTDPGSTGTSGTSGIGGAGGLTAGIGGGIAGSAVMGGAALLGGRLAAGASVTPVGGAAAGSTAARPAAARAIGAGRTSGGATLGRSTTTTAATPATGARGAAAGTRGSAGPAGSRAAAAGGVGSAAGRGRQRGRDQDRPDQAFYATEDDWTDDEGHAPVLD
ncbi:hypothetical protein QWJ41_13885 [Nocardioides sp. SOB44]|uniref:PPE domain-containing protein n=1 Tax=Nocardioides cremeus TaxID=3058044 RepID=A0ABT8TS81_9ACTN|nr:hypothetical protein [Nocardioides cremeus]MDO3396815.1 hypothetical protein [Nocardioides cremeus]